MFFFVRPKTANEMRISDWSSDVCPSDLLNVRALAPTGGARGRALSWTAQRTWLGILAGRRLAHRPARTPPGCGLAKSAFFFGRFARFSDALRSLQIGRAS